MKSKRLVIIFFVTALILNFKGYAQFSLNGFIKTNTADQVSFALISIKNTQLSTISETDGSFSFKNLKPDTYIFVTKCLGFQERLDTIVLNQNLNFNLILEKSNKFLDEVVVNATRVDKGSGMAYNNIDIENIKKQNLGQDAPYLLNQLPSVVVNSDAGNAVGYTGIRIRGTDGTRINVTINGVPVNDAESQSTYYVNMPDLLSSTNNIQVQRGVGASTNGSGAFGASINFQTNELNEKPYSNVISTAGSFNTFRNTLMAGTGLLNDKFTLDARASKISSDGYINRASSNLESYYIAAGYYGKKSVIKFINFLGQEKTYQAWNYVSEDSINNGNRTYNSCGEYKDSKGNLFYYKNEVDNYKQNNFQLHFIHQINSNLKFNVTGHYTKGLGYYEQYKQGQSFSNYNLENIITTKGDTINSTDLIRRLWLNNDFVGGIFNFSYTHSAKLLMTLGGGYNNYFGLHYGRMIWAQYASNSKIDYEYNLNSANKNDGNLYLKLNIKPSSVLNVFIDMQVRQVKYSFLGFNDSLLSRLQIQKYNFFNPKFGLSYDLHKNLNIYTSFAIANKEPNRDDFVQSSPMSRPKPEQLLDLEIGAKYATKKIYFAANIYNMQYYNQLVLNGEINNVGAYNRVNVESSFRRGTELEFNAQLNKYFSLTGNFSLSQNKIVDFIQFIDSSDVNYTIYKQYKKSYKNTDISFSPNIVSSFALNINPIKNLEVSFINKYVGKQYLDNTSDDNRSIKPYNLLDIRINYKIKTNLIPEISFMFSLYNVLSENYFTNGYTYSYYEGEVLKKYNFYSPSAPINFLGGVSFKF